MVVVDIRVRQESLGGRKTHAFESGHLLDKLSRLDRLFTFAGSIQAVGEAKTSHEDDLRLSLFSV
jgi:hypothetical protein